ncbi:MAG: CBS domain-containing protein [Nitrospirales bacterium]|nr:MAG: CBS domain-containing protein [Nitrospirales bacterium]
MVSITEVMTKELKTISCEASVADTAQKMRDEQVGALFIEKNGKLVGSVSDRELVRKAVAERKDLEKTTVESIMTTPLNDIDSTKTLLDAQDTMRDLGVRHLAVREGGKIVGIISVGDLLAYFTWRA